MIDANVILWEREIGAVTWLENQGIGVFQYTPGFLQSGIELSPLIMPLAPAPYQFPELAQNTFKGLPGLLADSLPDKFGNAVIDAWCISKGRFPDSFNPVERLCYIGSRGMGALEFKPAIRGIPTSKKIIEVSNLVELSNIILNQRESLNVYLNGKNDHDALGEILKVGASAGGARAKAILAWNPKTNHFRSGQLPAEKGYEYWIMKFDGVSNNRDKEVADPQGYGKIEYAYYLMAKKAGIDMMPCRLFHEGGRSHFMTKRFDRTDDGNKFHMLSLGGMAHFDFNQPRIYSYEQALQVMKKLNLPIDDLQQQILRTIFNIVGRNQDDHVKNIAFLMNPKGEWRLSPAFDVIYSYNPNGSWTSNHQMSINGKWGNFTRSDIYELGEFAGLKPSKTNELIDCVNDTFKNWKDVAGNDAGINDEVIEKIQSVFDWIH